MILVEEELIKSQNKLLEWQKVQTNNALKATELIERVDFLENLHNWDQERLYQLENTCVNLKQTLLQKESAYMQELNNRSINSIENISTVQLFSIAGKRLVHKIIRRK